jgi:hypothetical protein
MAYFVIAIGIFWLCILFPPLIIILIIFGAILYIINNE